MLLHIPVSLTRFVNKQLRVLGPLTNKSFNDVDPFGKEELLKSLIGVVVLSLMYDDKYSNLLAPSRPLTLVGSSQILYSYLSYLENT